jgi:hypothetical protein
VLIPSWHNHLDLYLDNAQSNMTIEWNTVEIS